MSEEKSVPVIQVIAREFLYVFEPLSSMDKDSFIDLLAMLDVPVVDEIAQLAGFFASVSDFIDSLANIKDWSSFESYMEPLEKLEGIISSLGTVFSSIKEGVANMVGYAASFEPLDMINRLLDYLIVNYLYNHHPLVFNIISLIGLVDYEYDSAEFYDSALLTGDTGYESDYDEYSANSEGSTAGSDIGADGAQPEGVEYADGYVTDDFTWSDPDAAEEIWARLEENEAQEQANAVTVPPRRPVLYCKIYWDKIIKIITDPASIPRELYGWGGDFAADRFIEGLYMLFSMCGLPVGMRSKSPKDGDNISSRKILSAVLVQSSLFDTGDASLSAEVAGIKKGAKSGFKAYISGTLMSVINITDYLKLTLESKLPQGAGISFLPGDISFLTSFSGETEQSATVSADLLLQKPKAGDVFYLFGDGSGISLSVKSVGLLLKFDAGPPFDVEFGFNIKEVKLTLSAGDGDGFISSILPKTPIGFEANLSVGYSKEKGFMISGAIGGEITFEINKTISVITLKSVTIKLMGGLADEGGFFLAIQGTVSVSAKLGPLDAVVSGIGVELKLLFGDAVVKKPGNLSRDVSLVARFVPPNGVGLSLDASVIKGGGFLKIDNGRYFGILQLNFMNFGISVIGLLDTKDASGQPIDGGFSLLLLIFFNLPPIQLGFGFVLIGMGGLLALNRTIELEQLRAGLRERALGNIMFPADPIAQAPTIEKSLSKIFPPKKGIFVIAPMVQIGWGTPDPLIKAELGIMFELPSFNKIVLIARLRLALPKEDKAVAVINLDALGILQLDEGLFSLDAVLYDSYVTVLKLSGEMALRIGWKANKEFLLSIGGYHPAFVAPASFPKLERLAATLSLGNWFSLRLEAYMAVTSNSFQFGARADLRAKLGPIEGKASLYFDALIYFKPFRLQINFGASISVSVGKVTLLAISFDGCLSGPSPWVISGLASFTILCIKFKFKLEAKIGKEAAPEQIDPVDVSALLLEDIKHAPNWAATPPEGFTALMLRGPSADEAVSGNVVVHPLGAVQFSQKTAPLGVGLHKFGNAPIKGGKTFTITEVNICGVTAKKNETLTEDFAPAQFFDCTETERLKKPSFEEYDSGFRVMFEALDFNDASKEAVFDYIDLYVGDDAFEGAGGAAKMVFTADAVYNAPFIAPPPPTPAAAGREIAVAAALGASGRASISRIGHGGASSRISSSELNIRMKKKKYVVLDPVLEQSPGITRPSFTEALIDKNAFLKLGIKTGIITVWE